MPFGRFGSGRGKPKHAAEGTPSPTPPPPPPPPTPTKPAAPVLTGNAGDTQNVLNWNQPSSSAGHPITSYELQRDTSGAFGAPTTIYSAGLLRTKTDTGRTNGTPLYYRARAINDIGPSDWSNTLQLTPFNPSTKPNPPVLSGSAGNGTTTLTFVPGADGGSAVTAFRLYENLFTLVKTFAPTDARAVTLTGRNNDQTYTYYIIADNSVGASDPSNQIDLTPTAPVQPGGGPTLPAAAIVGRPASDFGFWGSYEVGGVDGSDTAGSTAAEVTQWQSQIGFNVIYPRTGSGNGYMYAYSGGQRLRAGSVLGAPYTSDASYDWQRRYETTGPFQAKRNGTPVSIRFYMKLHHPTPSAAALAAGAPPDQGPFGYGWWDDAGWADVCAKMKTQVDGARWLGGSGFLFDPEFGVWDYVNPSFNQAQTKTKIEQRGYEFGKACMEADPNAILGSYATPYPGSWEKEVLFHNAGSSDGAYFHTPGAATEDAFTPAWPSTSKNHEQWARMVFYRGMWRAMAQFGVNAMWDFQDAFWYHGGTQYGGVSLATAMRWNLWGIMSWMSRDPQLSTTTKNWLMRHFLVKMVSWAGTDYNNGYWDTQMEEPEYTDLLKLMRLWAMREHIEYGFGMTTPSSKAPTTPAATGGKDSGGLNPHSRGRPLGGRSYGYNLFTGAHGGGSGLTAALGNNPQGGGGPGQVITYGPDAGTATTPVNWSERYPVPTSRPVQMKASASPTPIATSPPTVSNLAAHMSGSSMTVTCDVRHAYGVWYVSVHRGATYDRANPESSFLGVMAMTFQPNNGTNLPPAGLTDPYMHCTFTHATNWANGQYVVLQAYSTKEDMKPVSVPVT